MAVYPADIRTFLKTHAPTSVFGDLFPPKDLEALKKKIAFLIQGRYLVWVERIALGKHQSRETLMYRVTASVHPVSLTAEEKELLEEAVAQVWTDPDSVDFAAQEKLFAALAKSKKVPVSSMAFEFC